MVKDIDVSLLKSFGVVKTANPFIKYIGYLLDDVVIGYIEYSVLYEKAEICNIFVNEDKRNMGVGFLMMKYLITYLKSSNIYNITLEVSVLNSSAISLYKKFGFVEVAKRNGYYNGVDGILMELILWKMFIF